MSGGLGELSRALEAARSTRSRTEKERILGAYLAALDDEALVLAARFLTGRAFALDDPRVVGAGSAAWRAALSALTGHDEDTVRDCMRAAGDAGEAAGLLLAARGESRSRPALTLASVGELAAKLARARKTAQKTTLLAEALRACDAVEAKYLVKLLSGGLRVGAMKGVVEASIARGFGRDASEVSRAFARTADAGDVALLARAGTLSEARVVAGRPVGFMLATALQSLATPPWGAGWVVEDKLDGIRAQAQRTRDGARLFARSGDALDGVFPELEDALAAAKGGFILDGEIVAVTPDGALAPFALLQERLNRRSVSAAHTSRVPVRFAAFDLLWTEARGALLDRPWLERRALLEKLVAEAGSERVVLLPSRALEPDALGALPALEPLRRAALARGAEGLVLKRSEGPYEAGRRGQQWVKVKEAFGTLDVVITAAEEGHGRRRGLLSDYTFAVRDGGSFVNVGKAYSGLTDREIEAMSARLSRSTTARFGRARAVKPEVVLEVAFDGINRSARHRAGYALRFPRIVRVRDDKAPEQASTVDDVAALFAAQGPARAR